MRASRLWSTRSIASRGVRTLTSSEEGTEDRGAYVTFVHTAEGDSGRFIADLARVLRDGPDPDARLQVDWRFGEGDYEPLLTLSCSPHLVGEVSEAVAGGAISRLRILPASTAGF